LKESEGFKANANMGRLNNQKFVQMPLGKLKDRLKQLCDLHGIKFQETEESYTSKASYQVVSPYPNTAKNQKGSKRVAYFPHIRLCSSASPKTCRESCSDLRWKAFTESGLSVVCIGLLMAQLLMQTLMGLQIFVRIVASFSSLRPRLTG
jgi:hypothetical protein